MHGGTWRLSREFRKLAFDKLPLVCWEPYDRGNLHRLSLWPFSVLPLPASLSHCNFRQTLPDAVDMLCLQCHNIVHMAFRLDCWQLLCCKPFSHRVSWHRQRGRRLPVEIAVPSCRRHGATPRCPTDWSAPTAHQQMPSSNTQKNYTSLSKYGGTENSSYCPPPKWPILCRVGR